MKLITEKGINGYKLNDIKKELSNSQFKKFAKWISGQAIGDYKGETIVYENDWIRFCRFVKD